ncbi:hypothetical protein EJ04DRAFT_562596 [Polyplosphaeria fusca]|uniref:F-box domain-containing protein n=1 Tax=Polyplosphaeria fusca TaxID=682080 RepID=A0A9P4R3Y6_9PLEO|nr:hypothetical protein EJ04DRAFT_562596 [Polyplosphaeria fusca]
MPTLVDLPVELLQDIFIDLREDPFTERESLLSLCRTCTRLRDVAQPFLYCSTDLPKWPSQPLESLKCLTRTIVARPDLADKVKSLAISTDSDAEALLLPDDVYKVFQDDIPKRDEDAGEEKEKEEDGKKMKFDHFAIVLFSRLGRLERLHLDVDTWPAQQLLQYIEESPRPPDSSKETENTENTNPKVQTTRKFPSLKHLTVSPEGPPFNLADFSAFLTLPSLQTAHFSETLASVGHAFGKKLDIPPNSVNLSRLVLEKCFMREKCLRKLLAACKNLRLLRVSAPDKGTYNWHGIDVGNTYQFTPEQLVNAISQTGCNSLAVLSAEFTSYYPATPHVEAYQYPNMRHLRSLRTLSIEQGLLPELERLPKKLKTLRLADASFRSIFEDFFETLVQVKKKWCTDIEEISVEGYGIDERIIELAKTHGGIDVSRDAEGYHRIGFPGLGCSVKVVDVSFFDEPNGAFAIR